MCRKAVPESFQFDYYVLTCMVWGCFPEWLPLQESSRERGLDGNGGARAVGHGQASKKSGTAGRGEAQAVLPCAKLPKTLPASHPQALGCREGAELLPCNQNPHLGLLRRPLGGWDTTETWGTLRSKPRVGQAQWCFLLQNPRENFLFLMFRITVTDNIS